MSDSVQCVGLDIPCTHTYAAYLIKSGRERGDGEGKPCQNRSRNPKKENQEMKRRRGKERDTQRRRQWTHTHITCVAAVSAVLRKTDVSIPFFLLPSFFCSVRTGSRKTDVVVGVQKPTHVSTHTLPFPSKKRRRCYCLAFTAGFIFDLSFLSRSFGTCSLCKHAEIDRRWKREGGASLRSLPPFEITAPNEDFYSR